MIITKFQPFRHSSGSRWTVAAIVILLSFLVLCQQVCYCNYQPEVARVRVTTDTDKAFFEINLNQPSSIHVVLSSDSEHVSVVSQRSQVVDHHAFTVTHLSADKVYHYAIMKKENSKKFMILFKGTIVTNDHAHQGRHNEHVHDMDTQEHYQHHYVNNQQHGHSNNDHHQEHQDNLAEYQTNYAYQHHNNNEHHHEQYQFQKAQYEHNNHHDEHLDNLHGDQEYQHNILHH